MTSDNQELAGEQATSPAAAEPSAATIATPESTASAPGLAPEASAPAAHLASEPPLSAAARQPEPAVAASRAAPRGRRARPSLDDLPSYGRSLLKIKVPVMVTLARKAQPVGRILELMPGSILQFNKPCDDLLELEVNGHRMALGECVKIGDKFGLRVKNFVLPPERFVPARR